MNPPPFDLPNLLRQHGDALRRLASELLRDPAMAEDAVQETWLAALRRPPHRHDGGAGWLRTVLHNVARRLVRGDRRRVMREQSVMAERAQVAADTAGNVARTEVAHRLLAAMDALSECHREAIWQRYFEGKTPREIAAATGVPVATVKSRLLRGLVVLREQLGEGDEADWRAAFATAFGFGKAAGAGVAPAAIAGGAIVMATWVKVTLVVGMLAIAGVWWWQQVDGISSEARAKVEVAADRIAANVGSGGGDGSGATPVLADRVVVDSPAVASTPTAPVAPALPSAVGTVRGHVVDADTQQPLVGVRVSYTNSKPTTPSVLTGADGRFEISADAKGATWLRLARDDLATLECLGEKKSTANIDVGDLPMRSGRRLHGRIVSLDGTPVPKGEFIAINLQARYGALWRERVNEARPDDQGRFATVEPVPFTTTTWNVPFGPVEMDALTIDVTADTPSEVDLHVHARATIRGVVVDEQGAPVRRGVMLADQPGIGTTTVGDDGSFTMDRGRPGNGTTVFVSQTDGFAPHEPIRDVPWGTANLRIVLTRLPEQVLQVVDGNGTPFEAFGVALRRNGMFFGQIGAVRQQGEHAAGHLQVVDIVPGVTWLRVVPTSAEWQPSEPMLVGSEPTLRVVLQHRDSRSMLVAHGGRPIADAHVEIVRERGVSLITSTELWPLAATAKKVWMDGAACELLAEGSTDAAGLVSLRADADLSGCVLRVTHGKVVDILRDLAWPADGPLRVELPDRGSLRGRIVLRDCDPAAFQVRIADTQYDGQHALSPSADGTFGPVELPVASYHVILQRKLGPFRDLAEKIAAVAADEEARVEFAVADHPLASVHGRVASTTGGLAGLRIELLRELPGGTVEPFASADIAADGSYAANDLLPGVYRIAFGSGGQGMVLFPGVQDVRCVLTGGADTSLALSYEPRRLVVHFVGADGNAVRSARMLARCAGATWPSIRFLTPLVDEKLVIDPAPTVPIEFRTWDENTPWSAPVQMPPDRAEADVTVVLPDAPR